MTEQDDTRKKSRRDLILVLLILPLGVLCMFATGQVAIRLAPNWVLQADMRSLLDPNAEFAAGGKPFSIQPLNPNILTLPAWGNVFLTPNAAIPTRVILTATPPPPPVRTLPPPVILTPEEKPEATSTAGYPIILPTRNTPLQANLMIEKSDNSRTYTPGTAINYVILVTNLGPDPAPRFNVIDHLPAGITVVSMNCTPADLCGNNTSSGNRISYTGANLPYAGTNRITITINGQVSSGTTGTLSNTAEIEMPVGSKWDPVLDNNTVTDTDTQLSVYDLAITKSDGTDTYTATTPLVYTIVATNNGPSDALGVRIRDNIPAQIASWTWVCTTVTNASGCDGANNSVTNFTDAVNIQLGGRIEYTVTAIPALLSGNPQIVSNTARVILPGVSNVVDPDITNNSSTDTNSPYIDLGITKEDGSATYTPGSPLTYTITATNNSTFNLSGVTVTDNLSPMFTTWTSSCAADPGASCTASPPDTNINDTTVSLPPGASVRYTIDATVNGYAAGALENTATVDPPAGLTDTNPANNTATDSNSNAVASEPNIGLPNGAYPPWFEGSSPPIIMVFSPAIVADGDAGTPDFVYYEYEDPLVPGTIALDWVQIEISTDGVGWITVFDWGDGNSDTNSNVALNLISDLPCSNEEDNCNIPFGRLYNQTGITIDVDPLVPSGSYAWIRITAPASSPDGLAPEVDAIQPYYP